MIACSTPTSAVTKDEARVLAQIDAFADVCSRALPDLNVKVRERVSAMFAQIPDDDLAAARELPEYRQQFDTVASELGRQAKEATEKTCKDFVAGM